MLKQIENYWHNFYFAKRESRGRQFFVFNDLLIITNLKLKVKTIIEMTTVDIKRGEKSNYEFQIISIHHNAFYETDEDKRDDLESLFQVIDDNRSKLYRESLYSVGADEIAKLLKGSRSVSQGRMFRDQVSLRSQSSLNSHLSLSDVTSATSNQSAEQDTLYD